MKCKFFLVIIGLIFHIQSFSQKIRLDKNDKAYIQGSVALKSSDYAYLFVCDYFNSFYEGVEFSINNEDNIREEIDVDCIIDIPYPEFEVKLNFNLIIQIKGRLLIYKITNIIFDINFEEIGAETYVFSTDHISKEERNRRKRILNSVYNKILQLLDNIKKRNEES